MKQKKSMILLGALAMLLLPELAWADPGDKLLNGTINLLTNKWGVAVGVLAIIWQGYKMLDGKIDRNEFLITMAGIVVIFSAAFFADMAR